MISYSSRRHSAATSTYRSTERENSEEEASRRVSLGANLDKRYQPSNARLSPNSKAKWASDNSVNKPAFIVNNPATWSSQTQKQQKIVKKLQPAIDRRRRIGVPSHLPAHVEVQESERTPAFESQADEDVSSLQAEPEQPTPSEPEPDPFDAHSDYWQLNPVRAASWNKLHSDEGDFKAWKSQIMNEIKESKVDLDQKFAQLEIANKKVAAKKKVRIAEPKPTKNEENETDMYEKKIDVKQVRQITVIVENSQDEIEEDDEVKQVIPRWKRKPGQK